jgi:ribosomal-protein-alanine acetyltransferase
MGDLDAVVAIECASFADPWTAESFVSVLGLPHMRFLVAEEGDELLGYVVAMVVADEGEIADLAVAPAARRRGIGGLLLDRVAGDAAQRGTRSLYLEVRESNSGARALYESRGFVAVGRRRGYYQHPREDALLLRREVNQSQ